MSSLKHLILPPTGLLLVALVGLLLLKRRRRLGITLIVGSLVSTCVLMQPYVAAAFLISLQNEPALPLTGDLPEAQAVVVLGGDIHPWAQEWGGASLGPLSLQRIRYAAHVTRRSGLPLLVTGGVTSPESPSLADLMARTLEQEFGVEVRWRESRSRTTRQNARLTAELLEAEDVRRILLVTHAWHMPRARAAFESAGLEVVPAPTGFRTWPDLRVHSFFPSGRSLQECHWALHEWLGRAWYALTD